MPDTQRPRIRATWAALLGDTRQVAGDLTRLGDEEGSRRLEEHADAMLTDLRHLAGALLTTGDQVARRVPGYALAARQVRRAEAAALDELKRRLDEISSDRPSTASDTAPARMLEQLLADSLESDPHRSRRSLYLRILRAMLPDEARILSALADGTRFAMIHVDVRSAGGIRRAVSNACTVGRAAGIHLSSAVPLYVGHLRELGLAEEGPAEELLSDQYALLGSEDYVQRALAEADGGLRGSRTVRRTLRITPLGTELWRACRPDVPASATNGLGETTIPSYLSAYAGMPPLPTHGAR